MKYFLPLFLFITVFVPQSLFAADLPAQADAMPSEIVSCQNGGECDFCDLMQMASTINKWILGIAVLIGIIIAIYAGYRITASRGDVSIVTEARKLIGNVAVGIIIIVIASFLVDILMKTVTGGEYGWWNPPSNEKCGKQDPRANKPPPEYAPETSTVDKVYIPTATESSPDTYERNDPGYEGAGSAGSGSGGANTWDDPATGGTSYVDENGFIDVVLPGASAPPVYNPDTSGPQ